MSTPRPPVAAMTPSRNSSVRESKTLGTPSVSEERALLGAPGGREHTAPTPARQHHRGQSDSAGAGMNQHVITWLHRADGGQSIRRGHVGHRHARSLLGRERRRPRHHERRVDRDMAAQAARRDRHHLRADLEVGDALAHRDDVPAHSLPSGPGSPG